MRPHRPRVVGENSAASRTWHLDVGNKSREGFGGSAQKAQGLRRIGRFPGLKPTVSDDGAYICANDGIIVDDEETAGFEDSWVFHIAITSTAVSSCVPRSKT